ncbi:MAG: hypothetical protein LBS55_07375 [Prevotellaceae bacterium]|jgi:hypothetical protein|nr:hypothetical protein [Prevotellaceae bacterium]
MVNILLGHITAVDLLKSDMVRSHTSGKRTLVIPYSWREYEVSDIKSWNTAYARISGVYYPELLSIAHSAGISSTDVDFLNYYQDDYNKSIAKISFAEVLILPGGMPDLFMNRIERKGLLPALQNFNGVAIGISAGAMIQFEQYHITPDYKEYYDFSILSGIGWIRGYDVEVHYSGLEKQIKSIEHIKNISNIPVICLDNESGVVFEAGRTTLLGKTFVY